MAAWNRVRSDGIARRQLLLRQCRRLLPHIASLFQKGDPYKCIDLPLTNYASLSYDKVVKNGKMVGLSTFSSYSFNERSMLSLGILENEYSAPGTEDTLVWGEEGGGSPKPTVGRRTQAEIRATVGPVPYGQ